MSLPDPTPRYLPFTGGLDLETPPLSARPGTCREAQNFEIGVNGRYRRMLGYERFDGQAAPSDAAYSILEVNITGSFSDGDTITGSTSSATAVVVAVVTDVGSTDYLVITKVSGTFESAGENLEVSATVEGASTGSPVVDGASTPALHAQYKNLAADEYRGDIAAATGSGSVLGVWYYNDVAYAFRNNAGGTAAVMFKSTSSGWSAVSLGFELDFTSGGTTEIEEGQTITGAVSGATAVLTRVVLQSGTWAGGDAVGKFIFASQTGTFQAENIDVGASTNLATIAADSSAITLLPGGRYEFVNHNFGGQAGTLRMYGCDGVNRGFEFDGTVFVPIETGMDTDTPTHVRAHKQQLFFAFAGSAQHSSPGFPYQWSPVTGASELAVGADITGFMAEAGAEGNAALGIYTRNKIHILYGNDSSDWNLVGYRERIGAYAYSLQQANTTLFWDDRGVKSLSSTQRFGNFVDATLSRDIQRWVNARRTAVNASCIVREKNQVRWFFTDSYALFVTFENNKPIGLMPILMDDSVQCMCSLEDNTGNEVILFGSDDGMVYRMEKGTSFDGGDIEAFLLPHYDHAQSPRVEKSYRPGILEIAGDGYAEFNFSYELGYTSSNIPQPTAVLHTSSFSPARWDSFTWDAFYWDGVTLLPSEFELDGDAENIGFVIRSIGDYFDDFELSGVLYHYIPRRRMQ